MKYHESVLLKEVVRYLEPDKGEVILDATFGFGGHSNEIISKIGRSGKIIAFEQDPIVFQMVNEKLPKNVILINDNFENYKKHLKKLNIHKVDKALFDLGVSSWHFDKSQRGFSFKGDETLDMRIKNRGMSAADIINNYSEADLADMFYYLADEYDAKKIAWKIVEARKNKKIERTSELIGLIDQVKKRHFHKINPATKVFQALRIEVNQELSKLKRTISKITGDINDGGRIAVITFHSKEDRIVKEVFKRKADNGEIDILTKKPIIPTLSEIRNNPSSRSAKMRVAIIRRRI